MATEKTPLSVRQPSWWWILWQAWKAINSRRLAAQNADLRGTRVVMTGANSGIGREAALYFAKCGASILFACREDIPAYETQPDDVVEELKAAAKIAGYVDSEFEWSPCDLSKLNSVKDFASRCLASGEPIDLLINNAGIKNPTWGTTTTTEDGFEIVHQVNFLSHVFLTLLLLPAIAKAEAPRIICTTSSVHYFATFDLSNSNTGKGSYLNNKLYYQTWVTELQSRLLTCNRYRHITIQGVHPGFVQTGILADEGKVKRKRGWFNSVVTWLVHYFCCLSSQQGSIAITNAATALRYGPDPATQGVGQKGGQGGGKYISRIWDGDPMPQTTDPQCRLLLWEHVDQELALSSKGLLDGLSI